MFVVTEAEAAAIRAAFIPLALLALAMMTGAASAQQRTFYDASGKVTGRSSASGNTITNYDSHGRVDDRKHHDDLRCERPQHWTVHDKPLTMRGSRSHGSVSASAFPPS
jgi:YD repeat-containing protein